MHTRQTLRTALAAARHGKNVVVASTLASHKVIPIKPAANLRHLDLAVLLHFWRDCGPHTLFDELFTPGRPRRAALGSDAALAFQRCVVPGYKLIAERWFPSYCAS